MLCSGCSHQVQYHNVLLGRIFSQSVMSHSNGSAIGCPTACMECRLLFSAVKHSEVHAWRGHLFSYSVVNLVLLKSYFTLFLQVMYSFPMLTSHELSCLPFKLFEGELFLNLAFTRTNLHWWWPCQRCIISNYQLWEVRIRLSFIVNKQLIWDFSITFFCNRLNNAYIKIKDNSISFMCLLLKEY